MTLEQLKAAWDAALEALKAKPEDAELKAAVTAAETAYNAKKAEDEEDPEGLGEFTDPAATKKYIDKLRRENAAHRTKNKELASSLKVSGEQKKAILKAAGIELETDDPEVKIKELSSGNQNLAFRNAILESAIEQGIAPDQVEFYEFLVSKAASTLEEGEELSDEQLAEIVKKVKTSKGSANSSVGKGKGKEDPPPGETGEISLDQFCRMTVLQKSDLYVKKPEVYTKLHAEAKAKKRLV